jgi:hypothetical protein
VNADSKAQASNHEPYSYSSGSHAIRRGNGLSNERVARASRCCCGALLGWETRYGYGGRRSLALCIASDCGTITLGDGAVGEAGLKQFLLGHRPVQRYRAPWLRFFFGCTRLGYRWRAHSEPCPICENGITVALDLPPMAGRPMDPLGLWLCLDCASTVCVLWRDGERFDVALDGTSWDEPADAIKLLKRALMERTEEGLDSCEEPSW